MPGTRQNAVQCPAICFVQDPLRGHGMGFALLRKRRGAFARDAAEDHDVSHRVAA